MSLLFSSLHAQEPERENINHEQAITVPDQVDSAGQSTPNNDTSSDRQKIDALTLALKTIIGFSAIAIIIGAFLYYKRLLNR